jgi:hypothetical protein
MTDAVRIHNGVAQALYSQREGKGWHGLGQPIPLEIARDANAIAKLLGATYTVDAKPAFYRDDNGKFIEIPNTVAQINSETGEVLSTTSLSRYHTDNRQPRDIVAAFQEELNANNMEISHASILKGGSLVAVCAMLDPEFDLVIGKGDRVRRYATLSTGYDAKNGTIKTDGGIRVVCENTWMMAISESERDGKVNRFSASRKLAEGDLQRLVSGEDKGDIVVVGGDVNSTSVKSLIANVQRRAKLEQRTYNEMANATMSASDVMRYFADVLEVKVEDLDRSHEDGRPMVSEKMKGLISTLTNAYHSAPGAAIAQGSMWGAFNAVTYYATHQKPVRDTKGDGTESARVASNLFGDAKRLKARAMQLALSRVAVAA